MRTAFRVVALPELALATGQSGAAPARIFPDTGNLIAGRKAAGRPTVAVHLPNHSHLSEAYAIGTADESLSGPILKFIEAPPR